jgi:hypothetical protein
MRIAEDGPAVGLGKIRGMRPKAKTKCMLNYNYPADLSIDRLVKLIRNTGTGSCNREPGLRTTLQAGSKSSEGNWAYGGG